MKNSLVALLTLFLLSSCTKDLKFEQKKFAKKIVTSNKDSTKINIDVPIAVGEPIIANSVNKAVFKTMKEIVYVGEKPFSATDYSGLCTEFINYYTKVTTLNSSEPAWFITIDGAIIYRSVKLINIVLSHNAFVGGAHGYAGKRSLLFDIESGLPILNKNLFNNPQAFTKFAESKFREKYKISANAAINDNSFMFESNVFQLPQTYFYTSKGFLLYYNVYEIASYAQGIFEVLIPYSEMKPYLKTI